jgi:putative membrane protein
MDQVISPDKKYLNVIKVVSVAIPVVVAILLFVPQKLNLGEWVMALPHVNAVINSLTALFLIGALVAIKQKNITLHKQLMTAGLVLGTIFLVSYVLYHSSAPSTVFGDIDGNGVLDPSEKEAVSGTRGMYLFVLLSHIGLSIVVVPFVLIAFFFALSAQVERHKRIVKFTFPIWLYVSITGVIVYFLISPYYA